MIDRITDNLFAVKLLYCDNFSAVPFYIFTEVESVKELLILLFDNFLVQLVTGRYLTTTSLNIFYSSQSNSFSVTRS